MLVSRRIVQNNSQYNHPNAIHLTAQKKKTKEMRKEKRNGKYSPNGYPTPAQALRTMSQVTSHNAR
jgi:hypothetical protein